MFEGSYADLRNSATLTGRYLDRAAPLKASFRTPTGWLPIRDARVHNLRALDVDIPTGVLTVITGVAGSGKSSLIEGAFLPAHPEAIVIDQSAMGTSSRSNPATHTGIMDGIRAAFAAANGVDAGLFSFNSTGACESARARAPSMRITRCPTWSGYRARPAAAAASRRRRSPTSSMGGT